MLTLVVVSIPQDILLMKQREVVLNTIVKLCRVCTASLVISENRISVQALQKFKRNRKVTVEES